MRSACCLYNRRSYFIYNGSQGSCPETFYLFLIYGVVTSWWAFKLVFLQLEDFFYYQAFLAVFPNHPKSFLVLRKDFDLSPKALSPDQGRGMQPRLLGARSLRYRSLRSGRGGLVFVRFAHLGSGLTLLRSLLFFYFASLVICFCLLHFLGLLLSGYFCDWGWGWGGNS